MCSKFFTLAAVTGLTIISSTAVLINRANAQSVTHQGCLPQTILVPSNVAVIYNTGSTNTPCYRIIVSPRGEASYVKGNQQNTGRISTALARKFYHDIKVAEPLSGLPKLQCMKPVSFGSSTFIRLGGQESPDVSCAANAKGRHLFRDSQTIAKALDIIPYTR